MWCEEGRWSLTLRRSDASCGAGGGSSSGNQVMVDAASVRKHSTAHGAISRSERGTSWAVAVIFLALTYEICRKFNEL